MKPCGCTAQDLCPVGDALSSRANGTFDAWANSGNDEQYKHYERLQKRLNAHVKKAVPATRRAWPVENPPLTLV